MCFNQLKILLHSLRLGISHYQGQVDEDGWVAGRYLKESANIYRLLLVMGYTLH